MAEYLLLNLRAMLEGDVGASGVVGAGVVVLVTSAVVMLPVVTSVAGVLDRELDRLVEGVPDWLPG